MRRMERTGFRPSGRGPTASTVFALMAAGALAAFAVSLGGYPGVGALVGGVAVLCAWAVALLPFGRTAPEGVVELRGGPLDGHRVSGRRLRDAGRRNGIEFAHRNGRARYAPDADGHLRHVNDAV